MTKSTVQPITGVVLALLVGACHLDPSDNADASHNLRDLCQLNSVQLTVGFQPTSGIQVSPDTVWATLRFAPVVQRNPSGPTGCRASGIVSSSTLLPLGIGGSAPSGSFSTYLLDNPQTAADSIGVAIDFNGPGLLRVLLPLAPVSRGEWFASRDAALATGTIAYPH